MSYALGTSDADDDSGSGRSAGSPGTSSVTLSISPDPGLGFILDTMEAREELGRPFLITLDVSASTPKNDLHTLLGCSATVTLACPGQDARHFNGIVGRVEYHGLNSGGYKYRLELRPWIWLLSHEQDCRIFQRQSIWNIMMELFRDAGFTDFADKRQNGSGDYPRVFCVQYRETTLDFVTRLMEQYGLYYYVTHEDGKHTLNFADDPNSHASVGDAIPYRYDQTGWRTVEDHVWDWSAVAQIQPGTYTSRYYSYGFPKSDLTYRSRVPGDHTYGSSEVYDYPGLFYGQQDGEKDVQVRMQDLATRRQMYGGTSNSRKLGAGCKFTLSGFPGSEANGEYLVTESVCTVQRAETRAVQDEDGIVDTFRCVLRAVPGSRPFRLANITPQPVIRGLQTARVTGEAGQEVTTNEYGCVKVKFHWDRGAKNDENSSLWIRVAQVWAGKAWGAMVIPRIGQEVVVEFLEGNPDRPLVTGCVYNADQTVPYKLPDHKTRSTMKSNSSIGGNGYNEVRFEDKKGSEEVFFHAQRNFNEVIRASHTKSIGGSTATTVYEGDRSVSLKKGNDTLTLDKGDRSTTVSEGDDTHTVSQGDRKIEVTAGTSTTTAGTRILLQVGDNTIEMTTSGITLTVGSSSVQLTSGGVSISGTEISADATETLTLSSDAKASVTGVAQLHLVSDGDTTLKGGLVNID